MATLEDLEAQLREEKLDRDTVAVYGDQLQALGDPRGELIAIDLEIEQSGTTPLLEQRRRELVETWLGPRRPNGAIKHGFVDLDATSANPVEQVRLAFSMPAARFVRSIIAVGPPKLLREAIAAIAEAPRPWVVRVVLRQWSEKTEPTIDRQLAAAFARAIPHLQTMEIDARHLFEDLAHPTVRRLRISGFDAIETLRTGMLSLPALAELDFALQCHLATARGGPDESLFSHLGARLPALVALDLSRNQPGFLDPHTLGGEIDIIPLLSKIGCRQRLQSLSLPPLAGPAIGLARAALSSMPALRDLAIARVPVVQHAQLSASFARPELTLRFRT